VASSAADVMAPRLHFISVLYGRLFIVRYLSQLRTVLMELLAFSPVLLRPLSLSYSVLQLSL